MEQRTHLRAGPNRSLRRQPLTVWRACVEIVYPLEPRKYIVRSMDNELTNVPAIHETCETATARKSMRRLLRNDELTMA